MAAFQAQCIVSVMWGNPYTEPPAGQPRNLWSATILKDGDAEAIRREFAPETSPGDGWAQCWSPIRKPVKRWTPERKAKNRRDRLRKRLEKKTPLLADVLYAEELARRPDYFDAQAIAREDAARDEAHDPTEFNHPLNR